METGIFPARLVKNRNIAVGRLTSSICGHAWPVAAFFVAREDKPPPQQRLDATVQWVEESWMEMSASDLLHSDYLNCCTHGDSVQLLFQLLFDLHC